MPHAYSEDQLVEQPAIGLFAELGRSVVSDFGTNHRPSQFPSLIAADTTPDCRTSKHPHPPPGR